MKANFKYLAMMLTAGLFMASCSNDEVENLIPETKGEPVQFQMGVTNADTRTTTGSNYVTTFVTGDAVGIFAYERAADGSNGTLAVTNAKYVLGADNNWTVEGSNGIYAENGKTFNYYAYYPYQTGVTDPASIGITVKADQSVVVDYNISDALTAKNTSVVAGATTVPLAFHHAFSLVQVNLKGSLADKDAVVTMQNVFPTAKLNTQTEITASAEGTSGTIKMYPMPANQDAGATQFAYRAIVPAQTVATGQSLLEITSGGKTYKFTYSTDVKYDAAKVRMMNVTLGESGQNTITIPASDTTIDNWGNSEAGTGTGNVEEVVTPLTQLNVPLTVSTAFTSIVKHITSNTDTHLSGNTDFWFHRQTDATTAVSVDATEVAVKAVVTGTKGSWNNSSFGFHSTGTFDRTQKYKLTFQAKSDKAGSVGVGIRNSDDTKGFRMIKPDGTSNWERNVTTPATTTDWAEVSIIFDLGYASTAMTSSVTTYNAEESVTTDVDVKGINIYLYNNMINTTLYVKNISLIKQ